MTMLSQTSTLGGAMFELGSRDASTTIFFSLALLVVVVNSVTSQTVCPTQCACHDVIVDCRFRSVSDVAGDVADRLPPEVEELDLGDNAGVTRVNRTSFPLLSRLRQLRMDACRLQRIESQTFEHLRMSLELLDLSANVIRTLELGAFDGLRSLRRLLLHNNLLTADGIPAFAFRKLSLTKLRLDSNRLDSLGGGSIFVDSEMVDVNLDGNELSWINASTFRALQRTLRSLTVSRNRAQILRLSPDAFHNFMFSRLSLASSGLQGLSFLENLASVEVLDVGGNPVGVVQLSWSSGLALSCLEARLSAINLTSVADAQLSSFRSARRLDLSANHISGTLNVDEFRSVPDLRSLDLSRNRISALPSDLGIRLSRLDSLNLSANTLTQLSPSAFTGAQRLSVLDVSYNRIQVLSESLLELFNSLTFIMLAGNPLHCNCELRWLRRWLANDSEAFGKVLDSGDMLCVSPSTITGPVSLHDEADFVCRAPRILSMTPNLVANETSRVMLSCLAEGDPAPEVVWRSPTNDWIGLNPPLDRRRTRTPAFWELRHVRIGQSGWYSCEATNLVGSRTGYTYLHVARIGDPPLNVSDLVFTAAAEPETAPATVTSQSHPLVTLLSSSSTFRATAIVTSASRHHTSTSAPAPADFLTTSVSAQTQDGGSTHPTTVVYGSYLTTISVPGEGVAFWKKVLLILGSAVGGILLLVLVFVLVILCVRLARKHRRRRRRTKSVPPALMRTIRGDVIRRPPAKTFPGISMAGSPPDIQAQVLALQGSTGLLPVSPTYGHPERLDLLSSEFKRGSADQLHTFERRKNGTGGSTGNVT